eukprot:1962573-Prymnesium_polylepis.1
MALPPTPANASTTRSHRQRSAMCAASFSGVTEYQPSCRTHGAAPVSNRPSYASDGCRRL